MEFIRFDKASNDVVFAGNKAARLAELMSAGFRVPAFFVIGSHAGYERLSKPVTPVRTLVLDHRRHRLRVQDAFEGTGRHRIEIPGVR